MSTDNAGHEDAGDARRHLQVGSEHVDVGQATIDVSQATIVQSPQSRSQAKRLAWSLIVLFIVSIALTSAVLLFENSQVHQVRENSDEIHRQVVALQAVNARLERQLHADCGFSRDLADLPVAVNPASGKATITVPKIISDSRAAWVGHGCPGHLPPPSPSFVKWAGYYHLPVVRDGG